MDLVRIRASSLGDLFDCAARWKARNIDHIIMPTSGAAQLGTAVHAGTALYDTSRMNNEGLTIDDCVGAVVDTIYHPEEDVDWSEQNQQEAEEIATALHKLYCTQIAPHKTYVAVEAKCDNLEIMDLGIVLTGSTDRVSVNDKGEYGICDLKTGRSAVAADGTVKTAGYAAQLGMYELLGSYSIGKPITAPAEIIGLQVAKTDRGRRVGIAPVIGARQLLLGTENEEGLLEIAASFIRAGRFPGNPRSQICSPKYCPI